MRNLDKYIPDESMHGKDGAQGSQLARFVREHKDNDFSWDKLRELKKMTKMAVIVKGVQCAEDARLSVECGADAVWVSNHGARQLDTTPASIEVLEECVKAVGGRAEVYFDGGVSRGTDVLKALALGANAVFVGRAPLWGLSVDGQAGVEHLSLIHI